MNNIEYKKKQKQKEQAEKQKLTTTTNKPTAHDVGPPPDDYRNLPIIPDVTEILSEKQAYLRPNIVDGVYDDPQQYLDVNIPTIFFIYSEFCK